MVLRPQSGLPLVFLAGCSILYNPDNLPSIVIDAPADALEIDAPPTDAPADAEPDAPTDAPPPIDAPTDANPILLDLTGFEVGFPSPSLPEGTGADHGRPAIILLTGSSIVGNAVVTASFLGSPDAGVAGPTVVGFDAYTDGTGGALAVSLPVMTDLGPGQTRTMRITLTQGTAMDSVDVPIDGLAELRLTASAGATVDASPDLYSHIDVVGNVHYTVGQASPVILRATGGVTITNSRIDVDAVGMNAGPHGCVGGGATSAGSCSPGGGGAGSNSSIIGNGSGGGGGGFSATAQAGGGGTGGMAGMMTGNDMLVPVITAANAAGNRGNGGGGGGAGMLVVGTAAGGVGGGGGGSLVLEAGGDITVTGTSGLLRSAGAAGSGGGGASGGGGGGGSGGAILVRSGATITAPGAWLAAAGGGAGPGNLAGGAGQTGRIRIDAAAGTTASISAMATTPAPVRGPSWDPAAPTITATAAVMLLLRGQPGRTYGISQNDQSRGDFMVGAGSGTTQVPITLTHGRNTLCAAWAPNASATNLDKPEARTCIDIAYVGP